MLRITPFTNKNMVFPCLVAIVSKKSKYIQNKVSQKKIKTKCKITTYPNTKKKKTV